MPDKKITVTDEMVAAALNAANEYGRDGGWLTSAGLCRSAITAALDAAPATDEDDRRPLTDTIDFAALWKQERARAEQAEQERDRALGYADSAERIQAAAEARVARLESMTARDHLNAARDLGHPLPKGATIPEGAAFWVRSPGEPWEFVSPGPDEDFDTSRFPNSQYILLDPPRPKGAEEIEAFLRAFFEGLGDVHARDIDKGWLADQLAEAVLTEDGVS